MVKMIFSAVVLLFSLQGFAAETPHYLFKIEKEGQPVSWIMGTQHQAISFSGFEGTEAALSDSDNVILEKPLSIPFMVTMDTMMDYGLENNLFAKKDQMSQHLTKKNRKRIEKFFKNIWPDNWEQVAQVFNRAPPGMTYYFLDYLSVAMVPDSPDEEPSEKPVVPAVPEAKIPADAQFDILDHQIDRAAEAAGKKIIPMDTLDSNLEFYIKEVKFEDLNALLESRFNLDGTIKSLSYLSDRTEDEHLEYERVKREYIEGTIDHEYIHRAASKKDFLLRRDEMWKQTMLESIATSPTFIAVGLAHVTRKGGLLETLKRQPGVTVTAYKDLEAGAPASCPLVDQ